MKKLSILMLVIFCVAGCGETEKPAATANVKKRKRQPDRNLQEDIASSWGGAEKKPTKDKK